jgi:hypothetical protein
MFSPKGTLSEDRTIGTHGHAGAAVPGGGVDGVQDNDWRVLTSEALRAVSSLTALTFLNLRYCVKSSCSGHPGSCSSPLAHCHQLHRRSSSADTTS